MWRANKSQMDQVSNATVPHRNKAESPGLVLLLLAAVLLLHLLTNSVFIGTKPFWIDESSTYEISRLPVAEIPLALTHSHKQPPLFYWVAHFVSSFGDSPAFLRGISFAFMAAALIFVMLGIKELSIPSRLLCSLLLTVSPFSLYLAREFRPYAMGAFFILISSVYLYRVLKRGTGWRPVITYGLAALGLQYSLILNSWVFGCQMLAVGAVFIFQAKENGIRAAVAFYQPLLWICLILSAGYAIFLFWISHSPVVLDFFWEIEDFDYWSRIRRNVTENLLPIIAMKGGPFGTFGSIGFPVASIGLFLAGIILSIKYSPGISLYLVSIFAGQIAFSTYVTYETLAWFSWRYLTASFIAFIVLAALGYELLVARRWPGIKSLLPVAAILTACLPGAFWSYQGSLAISGERRPIRDVVEKLGCRPVSRNHLFCSPGASCAIVKYEFRNNRNVKIFRELDMAAVELHAQDGACILYLVGDNARTQSAEIDALARLKRRSDLVYDTVNLSERELPPVSFDKLYVFRPVPGVQ
jgi:hypothetical protein